MATIAETARPTVNMTAPWFYARVAALGFTLIAAGGAVLLGIAALAGELAGVLPFAGMFVVAGLIVAGLVWRFRTWPLVLSGLLGLLLLAFLGPFAIFGLQHPEAANEFIPVTLVVGGAAVGLVGSVVGLYQRIRRSTRAEATPTEETAWKGLVVLIAGLSVISMGMTLQARTTVAAEAKAGAVSLELHDIQFMPRSITVKQGEKVRLVIKNEDTALHTFTFPEAGVSESIPSGAERLIEFQAPAKGTYTFYCIPHSHGDGADRRGMTGTLTVE